MSVPSLLCSLLGTILQWLYFPVLGPASAPVRARTTEGCHAARRGISRAAAVGGHAWRWTARGSRFRPTVTGPYGDSSVTTNPGPPKYRQSDEALVGTGGVLPATRRPQTRSPYLRLRRHTDPR